jgi:ATP-dependent Lhr-like helicase
MHRARGISLFRRESLGWLLPAEASGDTDLLASVSLTAQDVYQHLATRGALFPSDLRALAGLLPGHLDEALRELAAAGLVTADSFQAIRRLFAGSPAVGRSTHAMGGRWSAFPPPYDPLDAERRLENWCHLLLRRWGVVTRDFVALEPLAPPWRELHPVLRKWERRGELRGGRFLSQVSGEQFAYEATISQLRDARDRSTSDELVLLGACDPLNLFGLFQQSQHIPASHKNLLLVRDGRLLASLVPARGDHPIHFHGEASAEDKAAWRRILLQGKITPPSPILERRAPHLPESDEALSKLREICDI